MTKKRNYHIFFSDEMASKRIIQFILCILVLLVVSIYPPILAGSPSGKKAITIKTTKDTSLSDLITSSGYALSDRNLDGFLKDFLSLNKDVTGLSLIPKGTVVKLPVEHLTKMPVGRAEAKKEKPPLAKAKERKEGMKKPLPPVREQKEAKKKPLPAVQAQEEYMIYRSILTLLNNLAEVSSVKSGGLKIFSVSDRTELSLDTSFFPMIELTDKTMIMLDYRGLLPEELRDVIEVSWPEYKVINCKGIRNLKNSLALILNAIGYSSYGDSRVVLGGRTKVEFSPDLVVVKTNDDIPDGEIVAVTIVRPDEYMMPEALKEWARKQGIRIIELALKEPPLVQNKAESQSVDDKNLDHFLERFLSILGYPFKKDNALSLSGRKEYEFVMKPDMTVTTDGRVKAILFSEIPDPAVHYAKKRGIDVASIGPREERVAVIRKVLGLLSLGYSERPEQTIPYITPNKAKYRVSMPGILVRSRRGLLFFTDTEVDTAVAASLTNSSVKLVKF